MTNTFNTTELANDRVLVTGEDAQGYPSKKILDAKEFNALKLRDAQAGAVEEFDASVEAFFAPLTEAAERVQAAQKITLDPAFFITIQEGEAGTAAKQEILHQLGQDTVVLRLIEQGNTARLIWVGDDIEILAANAVAPAPVFDPAGGSIDLGKVDTEADVNPVANDQV